MISHFKRGYKNDICLIWEQVLDLTVYFSEVQISFQRGSITQYIPAEISFKYNVDGSTKNKFQCFETLTNQRLLDPLLTLPMSHLTVKSPLKQTMLDKPLPKRGNRRKRHRNQKNATTTKTGVGATHLLPKTVPPPIRLTKNNIDPANHVADFYTRFIDAILSLKNKKIR